MIFVYNGVGWSVPFVGFGGLAAFQAGIDAVYGKGTYTNTQSYQDMAIWFAAGLIFLLGLALNRRRQEQEQGDSRVARVEKVRVKAKHDFFYIPYQWCGPLLGAAFYWIVH